MTFKKVAELGNFTRASEALGYAQSSVTAHIQALESDIGAQLFDRIGKKIELTNKGVQLLDYVNELLEIYTKIENITQTDEEPRGSIRIGVPETLMLYRLDEVFKQYKKLYPNVTIILENTPSAKLIDALYKGDLDIAFVLDHEIKDTDLKTTRLIDEEMCFVFPPDIDIKSIKNIPDDLSIFLTEKDCSYRYIFEHHLKYYDISSDNIMETWSIETIKKCVMNSIGMSFLPYIAVKKEAQDGKLITLPSEKSYKKMVSQVIYHRKKWLSPAMKAFLDLTIKDSINW
jgi:DNA-binding transcriptional LysR family regulator